VLPPDTLALLGRPDLGIPDITRLACLVIPVLRIRPGLPSGQGRPAGSWSAKRRLLPSLAAWGAVPEPHRLADLRPKPPRL